jgi:hypothetical protein
MRCFQVDFGVLFEGESRTKTLYILNNSPETIKYCIDLGSTASMAARHTIDDDADQADADSNPHAGFVAAARSRAQALNTVATEPFEVSPRAGELGPFSKVPIFVEYAPRISKPSDGFKSTQNQGMRTHRYVAALEFGGDTKRPRMLTFSGSAHTFTTEVSPRTLLFGDVPCHSHRHLNSAIKNVMTDQLVRYRVRPTVPHFSIEPPEATIAPQATQFIAAVFHPRSLGRFQGKLVLELLSESGKVIAEQTIAVVGTSNVVGERIPWVSGVGALPEDFKAKPCYASEAEIAKTMHGKPPKFERIKVCTFLSCCHLEQEQAVLLSPLHGQLRTAGRGWLIACSAPGVTPINVQAWKSRGTEEQVNCKEYRSEGDNFRHSLREQQLIAAHRCKYNSCIQNEHMQHMKRMRKTGQPWSDEVNLGMKTWAGLGTGDPNFRVKPEPLWLADRDSAVKCTAFKGFPSDAATTMTPHKVYSCHLGPPPRCGSIGRFLA